MHKHYPTNAFHQDVITCVSDIKSLEVKKKHVITKVNTFKDLMMLTKSDEEKKQKIIQLLTENYSQISDKNYLFQWDDLSFLMVEDKEFYLKICQIFYSHFDRYPDIIMSHIKALLKDPAHLKDRAAVFE